MAESLGVASLELEGDLTPLGKSLEKAKRDVKKGSSSIGKEFAGGLKKAALPAAAVLGALAVGAVKAIGDASDLNEQMAKTEVVFRGSEDAILSWSEGTASALGISRRAALEATGVFGNMLVPMGIARDKAGQMSMKIVELAADMASFNNASPEETLDALRAGLAGESEPLRRFGVFLNEARIKEEALRLGLVKNTKEALPAAVKAQATYSLILKDTADAQGDFARTSDSVANQERILRAEVENLSAELGTALLPAMAGLLGFAVDLVGAISENTELFAIMVGLVGSFAGAILLANASLAIYNAEILVAVGATTALRVAMAAVPWLLAASAAAGLIAYLMSQRNESDEAADAMDGLTNSLHNYTDAVAAGKDLQEQYGAASRRVETAEIALRRAREALHQVTKDDNATLDQRREAQIRVADARQSLTDAEREAEGIGGKLRQTQLEGAAAMNSARVNLDRMHKAFKDWAGNKKIDTALERRKLGIEEDAFAMHTGARNADRWAAALRNAAAKAEATNPKLAETARVAARLSEAWGRVVSLPQARTFVATFRVITQVETNREHPGGNARGTTSWGGGLSWVGDTGPELVNLPRGSQVYTARQSQRMAAGGGEVHFHFNRYVGGRRELIADMGAAIADYRRQHGGREPF